MAARGARREGSEIRIRQSASSDAASELRRLQIEAASRMEQMKATIDRQPTEARKVLESLMSGPMLCAPDLDRGLYEIRAPLEIPEALGLRIRKASPAGFRRRER